MMLQPGTVTDIGPYRIVLGEDPQADAVAIYVYTGRPNQRRLLRLIATTPAEWFRGAFRGAFRWDDVDPLQTELEPTLKLPADILDAIVDARAQVRPADTGATEALTDTRQVRDRLLGLVERIIDADLAREAPIPPADIGTGR